MSRSLLTVASLEMTLPREVKCSTEVGAMDVDMKTVCFSWRDWYNTSVFFRLMARPKFLAASEKRLTTCYRAPSVWARRAYPVSTDI